MDMVVHSNIESHKEKYRTQIKHDITFREQMDLSRAIEIRIIVNITDLNGGEHFHSLGCKQC